MQANFHDVTVANRHLRLGSDGTMLYKLKWVGGGGGRGWKMEGGGGGGGGGVGGRRGGG